MNPEAWVKVKEVLGQALELPDKERAAFIEERCGGDPALRDEVETLLRNEDQVDPAFLDQDSFAKVAASSSLSKRIHG